MRRKIERGQGGVSGTIESIEGGVSIVRWDGRCALASSRAQIGALSRRQTPPPDAASCCKGSSLKACPRIARTRHPSMRMSMRLGRHRRGFVCVPRIVCVHIHDGPFGARVRTIDPRKGPLACRRAVDRVVPLPRTEGVEKTTRKKAQSWGRKRRSEGATSGGAIWAATCPLSRRLSRSKSWAQRPFGFERTFPEPAELGSNGNGGRPCVRVPDHQGRSIA